MTSIALCFKHSTQLSTSSGSNHLTNPHNVQSANSLVNKTSQQTSTAFDPSRWLWGVHLRKPNVSALSWRSMTTGMRGKRRNPGGSADAEADECPKAICEHPELSKQYIKQEKQTETRYNRAFFPGPT